MGKRIVAGLMGCCLLILAGCLSAGARSTRSPDIAAVPTLNPGLLFEARYVRIDGYAESEAYPSVVLIRSKNDLDEYIQEMNENSESGVARTFAQEIGHCDEAFFETKMLALTSGSIRHEAASIVIQDGAVTIIVDRFAPEVGTDDMAKWLILIELDNSYAQTAFAVKLVNVPDIREVSGAVKQVDGDLILIDLSGGARDFMLRLSEDTVWEIGPPMDIMYGDSIRALVRLEPTFTTPPQGEALRVL